MNKKNIVIIGGGSAAIFSAQAASSSDKDTQITMILGEKRLPYYRTRICEVFAGLDPDALIVKPQKWYEERNITLVMDEADKIDTRNHTVELKNGGNREYDELIIATGAKGNRLPVPGNDLPGVFSIRTLDDVAAAQKFPGPVVIIGGGLLGLEAAWHLKRSGRDVDIVEHGPWLLGRQLDEEAGNFFLEMVRNTGIGVTTKANLSEIAGEAPDLKARFADGAELSGGLVIFAAGIVSDTVLGREAGLETNRAIVVDKKMRTSAEHIYACGDCAEYEGRVGGLWTVAMAQGNIAGQNAAGQEAAFQPEEPPYLLNAIGTRIWSNGNINTEDNYVEKDGGQAMLKKLFFIDNALCGAVLIGDVALQGKLKEAIKAGFKKEQAIGLLK